MSELAVSLLRRYDQLKALRLNWDTHWQEIVDYLMPYRQGITSVRTPGQKTMDRIYDSSPIHAQFLFAAGLHGMMTNPATKWFSLEMQDEELNDLQPVKWWLWEVERRMFRVLNNTNFATQVNEGYLDYGGFGMFCMFCGEDSESVTYFNTLNLAEIVAGENSRGQVDTLMRRFNLTARQVLQDWPATASSKAREAINKNPDKPVEILHAVYPRREYNPANRTASQMPIGSTYLEVETKQELSNRGFLEFPYLVPRFSVATNEVYGRGPGMIALPDVKQLNQMEEDMLRAAQKKIDPPIMIARDSFTGPIRFVPGGVAHVRTTSVAEKMAPFPTPGDLGYGEEKSEAKRQQIGRIFYNDMLQLIQSDRMTALEVMTRTEEKLRLMGPMLGRLQVEFLKPLITRLFGIMHRAMILPPAPPVLAGREINVQFVSPLAKAQRIQEAQGVLRTLEAVLPVANLRPDVLDPFDWDQTVRLIAEVNAVPAILIKAPEQVTEERAAREQMMREQMAVEQLAKLGQTVDKAIPGLSQPVQPGSPLDAIVGGAQESLPGPLPEVGSV